MRRFYSYTFKGFIIAFLFLLNDRLNAQTITKATLRIDSASLIKAPNEVRPLTVGDLVPDIPIKKIINYKTSSASISTFKDKVLVLDFMATSCLSCIEALPKLDSLQKKFSDQIQVFVVTWEKMGKVKNFFEKNKIGQKLDLPFVTEDSILKRYFPHEFISHVVWLNKIGLVKAITGTQYLKPQNVKMVIDDVTINWPIKKEVTEYDLNKPLMAINENNIPIYSLPSAIYYSSFSPYMPGITKRSTYNIKSKSSYIVDSVSQLEKISLINYPIIELYQKALDLPYDYPLNRMILDVSDRERFIYDPDNEYKAVWSQNNAFCYEATFPIGTTVENKKRKTVSDLNLYLNLNARMEIRSVKCLVLSEDLPKSADKIVTTDNKSPTTIKKETISIASLIYRLNNGFTTCPVINETGYYEKKNLQLNDSAFNNIQVLREKLKENGIKISEQQRYIKMLVITENDGNLQ